MKINNRTKPCAPPGPIAWRWVSLLVVVAVAAGMLAGCGSGSSGGSVAHINTSTTANASSGGSISGSGSGRNAKGSTKSKSRTKSSAKPSALAYAQCIRAHGVPNFPDPNSQGQIVITPAGNLDTAAYTSAEKDCKSLSPYGKVSSSEAAGQQKQIAELLKYAVCMRAHGVSNFPDPGPTQNGGAGFPVKGPNSPNGFDPNTPAVKRAQTKCESYMPRPSAPGAAASAP